MLVMVVSRLLLRPVLFPRQVFLTSDPYIDFGGRNPAAQDARNLQLCSHPERRDGTFKRLRRDSGVDQSAKKHIAADARKTL